MASISKSYGYDVGRSGDPTKPRRVTYKGERRGEKVPRGVAERFVDLQGNVVVAQLVGPGIPPTQEAISRARADLHARKNNDGTIQGFVEHGKCPLRHGTRHRNELIEDEFAAMPEALQKPCGADPEGSTATKGAGGVRTINHGDGCPHIEWLITERVRKEAERTASRRANRESPMDLERRKLAAMQQQADEARKTNEKLVEVLAAKPRRNAE
jgi:hypothetical protein